MYGTQNIVKIVLADFFQTYFLKFEKCLSCKVHFSKGSFTL